jgi:hypothetical protein
MITLRTYIFNQQYKSKLFHMDYSVLIYSNGKQFLYLIRYPSVNRFIIHHINIADIK